MINMAKTGFFFIFACLFISFNAFAQQDNSFKTPEEIQDEQIKMRFKEIDTNNDGFITSEEILNEEKKIFKEADKDQNGLIEGEETEAVKTRVLGEADKNNDQIITPQEAEWQAKEYFNKMDTNRDNKVSEDEYTDYWKMRLRF